VAGTLDASASIYEATICVSSGRISIAPENSAPDPMTSWKNTGSSMRVPTGITREAPRISHANERRGALGERSLGVGTEVDLVVFFVSSYFGLKVFGPIYGLMFAALTFANGIGPSIVG
jgi:hypothetical protein